MLILYFLNLFLDMVITLGFYPNYGRIFWSCVFFNILAIVGIASYFICELRKMFEGEWADPLDFLIPNPDADDIGDDERRIICRRHG